jgi:hypothetical protein
VSDFGSEMGAAMHGQRSPAPVNVASCTALTCPDTNNRRIRAAMCSVRIEGLSGGTE